MKPKLNGWMGGLLWMIQPPHSVSSELIPYQISDLLPKSTQEWSEWQEVVAHNEIEPQILAWVKAHSLEVPKSISQSLHAKTESIREATAERWQRARPVLEKAREQGLRFLILKGNAIAEEIYKDSAYKKMNDVDILIQKNDRDAWWNLLEQEDFTAAAAVGRNSRDGEKHSHHWPPLFSRDLKCVFGIHWDLVSPLREERLPLEEMRERSVPTQTVGGLKAERLSGEDFLLHLCVHLSATKVGLREISDVLNFYQAERVDLLSLAKLAERSHSLDGFCRAFHLLDLLFENEQIQKVLEIHLPKASRSFQREMAERVSEKDSFFLSRTNLISKIEMAYGLFQLTEHPLEKAYFLGKMWRHLVAPPLIEARRFCYVPRATGIKKNLHVRWLTPIRVSQTMAKDLGWPILIAITIRHEIQLAQSIPRALLRKSRGESLRSLKDVARQAGVEIETLRNAKFLN